MAVMERHVSAAYEVSTRRSDDATPSGAGGSECAGAGGIVTRSSSAASGVIMRRIVGT
jgi:hypothetical protein